MLTFVRGAGLAALALFATSARVFAQAPAPASAAPDVVPAKDLDSAADATAAVATVTPLATVAPSAAASSAEASNVDLSALGLSGGETSDDAADKLNIYGYLDMNFTSWLQGQSSTINAFLWKEPSFFVGNFNLYLAKNITPRWRSLAEVRFMYTPNGAVQPDGTLYKAVGNDPTATSRNVTWGGISIERAYLEYEVHPALTIRAGSFLTPYGIWNVDHGSPTLIGVGKPYIIGEQIFPERQSGLEIYGKVGVGDVVVGYHGTLSNGRGPTSDFRDLDYSKAFGGRLFVDAPYLGRIKVGISAYGGRSVDRSNDKWAPDATGTVVDTTPTGVRYDERAYAADLLWQWKGLHVQSEFIGRDVHFVDGARLAEGGGFRPDGRALGWYVLAGWRFNHFWNVMPAALVQSYQKEESGQAVYFNKLATAMGILNFRPDPSIVLKIQAGRAWVPDANPPIGASAAWLLGSQVAWVF